SHNLRSRHALERSKNGVIKTESLHVSAERAGGNPSVVEKWHIEKSENDCRQRTVADANALPEQRQQHDGKQFHSNRQPKRHRANGPPPPHKRSRGRQKQQYPDNVDVTATRHLRRQQGVPNESQNPVLSLAGSTQEIEQHEHNR